MPLSRRLLLLTLFLAGALCAADLTGKWSFTVETDAGSGSPTITLKQTGDQLTGSYSGTLGEAKVSGTVKGQQVELKFTAEYSGEKIPVTYTGTIESADKLKGTAEYGSLGKGTWTAVRQQ